MTFAEGHLRVERIIAGELHAAGAADVGVGDIGGEVEGDFLAAGLGGRGEVAEGLLVDAEAARVDVGVERREQRGGAFAQCGGAVGGSCNDAGEARLGLLHGVEAGELELIALHVEARLAVLHVAGGMSERCRWR